MKKLVIKIKRIFVMLGVFIASIWTKVLAATVRLEDISEPCLYAPPPISKSEMILRFIKNLFIPIAFITGIIIYLTKSKSTIKRKIVTIIIALLLVILIQWVIKDVLDII